MPGLVFDTSVYVSAFRRGDASVLDLRRATEGDGASHPLWLSAVVLSEMLVGAAEKRTRARLIDTAREFNRIKRMLVPLESDWRLAGEVIGQIGAKYGYEHVGRARMTNDALIAMSAARTGLIVLTRNAEDFKRIAEFRPFQWKEV